MFDIKTHQNYTCCLCYGPTTRNTCVTNGSKICQFFRFGLHPYNLATLHATIATHYHLVYRIKHQNQGIYHVTKA